MRRTQVFSKIPWTGGLNATVDPGVLNDNDLVVADNIVFTTNGSKTKREGYDEIGSAIPAVISRSSSGTTRTLVLSSSLVIAAPKEDILVVGEKIRVTSNEAAEEDYLAAAATITSITTTNVTNDTITYEHPDSLTESDTATTTMTVQRDETIIGIHDYWYFDSTDGTKKQLLLTFTDNGKLYYYDVNERRVEVLGQEFVDKVVTRADSTGDLNNDYFRLFSANNETVYVVWYNVNGAGTDPAITDTTSVEVAVATDASANDVATATAAAVTALADFSASASTNEVTITRAKAGITSVSEEGIGTGFTFSDVTLGATLRDDITKARFTVLNETAIIAFDTVGAKPIKFRPTLSAKYQILGDRTTPDFDSCTTYLSRVWANDKSNPDRVHYSETAAIDVWQGAGDSGALDVTSGDGDNRGITAIFPFKGILFVGKAQSKHRIIGNSPENFVIEPVSLGMGVEAQGGVVAVDEQDVFYVSRRGIHSTVTTNNYGDTESSFLSQKIQPIFSAFPQQRLKFIEGAFIPQLNSVAFSVTEKGQLFNNSLYLYNILLQAWFRWPNIACTTLTRRLVNNQFRLIWGTNRGRVLQAQNGTFSDLGDRGISYRVKTGSLYPGQNPQSMKRFRNLSLLFKPTGNFAFTCIYKIDNYAEQALQFAQEAGGARLGVDFVLGESVLGVNNVLQPYTQPMEGIGRGVTLEIVNTGSDEQVEVYGFMIEYDDLDLRNEVIQSGSGATDLGGDE